MVILYYHGNLTRTLNFQSAFCSESLRELLKHLCVSQMFVTSGDQLRFTGGKNEKTEGRDPSRSIKKVNAKMV